jgi:hypothetical protein
MTARWGGIAVVALALVVSAGDAHADPVDAGPSATFTQVARLPVSSLSGKVVGMKVRSRAALLESGSNHRAGSAMRECRYDWQGKRLDLPSN